MKQPKILSKNQTTNQIPEKSKSNLLPIILSVVITLLIVGGGVYTWHYFMNQEKDLTIQRLEQQVNNLTTQIAQLQQDDNSDNKNREEDGTKNWNSYSNKEFKFSFKYPPYFKIVKEEIVDTKQESNKWFRVDMVNTNSPREPFNFRFETNPGGYGPIYWDKIYNLELLDTGYVKIKDSIDKNDDMDKENLTLGAVLEINDQRYMWIYDAPITQQGSDELFKQILGTFQFQDLLRNQIRLDNNELNSYKNTKYNFEFTYPIYFQTSEQIGEVDEIHNSLGHRLTINLYNKDETNEQLKYYFKFFKVSVFETTKTLDDFWQHNGYFGGYSGVSFNQWDSSSEMPSILNSPLVIDVNNYKALKFTGKIIAGSEGNEELSSDVPITVLLIKKGNNIFQFEFYNEQEQLAWTILNSLKIN